MKFTYEANGATHTIDLQRQPDGTYRAHIGETSLDLTAIALGDGAWLLRLADRQVIVHTASDGDARYVHVDGHQHTLSKRDARARRRASAAGNNDLAAQMPGQVLAVTVADGEAVVAGQTLVVLEAMKMEIRVAAPADGVVQRVLVQAGDVVERGQTLVELA